MGLKWPPKQAIPTHVVCLDGGMFLCSILVGTCVSVGRVLSVGYEDQCVDSLRHHQGVRLKLNKIVHA